MLTRPLLVCKKYSLSGSPDYLLESKYGYGVVVDVKWAEPARRGVKRDHKLQVGAYALLARCCLGINVKVGVVYYLKPEPKFFEVKVTGALLREVVRVLGEMREIVRSGVPPERRVSESRCKGCNYRAYCPC